MATCPDCGKAMLTERPHRHFDSPTSITQFWMDRIIEEKQAEARAPLEAEIANLRRIEEAARRADGYLAVYRGRQHAVQAARGALRAVLEEKWDDHAVNDQHPCRVCGRVLSHDHPTAEWKAALEHSALEEKP